MFKIAKNKQVDNENIDIEIVDAEVGTFNRETKKSEMLKIQQLSVSISGNINNNSYCLHFIINKPISDYLNIKKYDKIKMDSNKIIDNYMVINGVAYLDIMINIEIIKFNDKLIFELLFQESDREYFGTAEFEMSLKEIYGNNLNK